VPRPDVWITPVNPAGPSIPFGLTGNSQLNQYSSGSYVWTPVDRPRRKPWVEFTADQLWQLTLPLVIDGSDTDTSIEHICQAVGGWTKPTTATGEPPILQVQGPVDQGGITSWVVQTLTWGTDMVQRRRDGALTQHDLSLVLLEYPDQGTPASSPLSQQLSSAIAVLSRSGVQIPTQVAAVIAQLPTLLAAAPASLSSSITAQLAKFIAAVPNNPAGALQIVEVALPQLAQILPTLGGGRIYTIRDGDTLDRIAARELGDYRKAGMIATLNGIRDPLSIVSGQRILLP
jgi:hypothetical protein